MEIDKNFLPESKKVVCIETKTVFNSIREARLYAGLKSDSGVSECCHNKRKTSGRHPETGQPLSWLYLEDYIKDYDISTLTPYGVGA